MFELIWPQIDPRTQEDLFRKQIKRKKERKSKNRTIKSNIFSFSFLKNASYLFPEAELQEREWRKKVRNMKKELSCINRSASSRNTDIQS